jgi:hypothetical protein
MSHNDYPILFDLPQFPLKITYHHFLPSPLNRVCPGKAYQSQG